MTGRSDTGSLQAAPAVVGPERLSRVPAGILTAGRANSVSRLYRPTMLGLALVFLAMAAAVWITRYQTAAGAGLVAVDYRAFVDEGHRLLTTGTPYLPYQLAGPYDVLTTVRTDPSQVPFLYPPAFALVGVALGFLPAIVWWTVPLALIAYTFASWRPAPWTWPLLALVLVWPATSAIVIVGGTTMWVAALTAAGLRWKWPAAFILLKPSFLPLALIGVRDRRWWAIAIGIGVLSLPLLGQYVTAMRNATDVSLLYSLGDLPLVLAPVLAWYARQTNRATTAAVAE